MWVWPQLPFGGSPPSPHCTARPLPSSHSPSLPTIPLTLPPTPLHPLALFAMLAWVGVGDGVLGHGGVEGKVPPNGTGGQTHIWGHSLQKFWRFQACDSRNRAIRDSRLLRSFPKRLRDTHTHTKGCSKAKIWGSLSCNTSGERHGTTTERAPVKKFQRSLRVGSS